MTTSHRNPRRRGMLSRTDADALREMARLIRLRCINATPADLAHKRKTAGLSQGQVARFTGVTWLHVDMIERGLRPMDDELAAQLDRLYGTDPRFRIIGLGDELETDTAGDRDE